MDIGRIAHGGVYIYRGELDFMARTILDSPHMETGGNLFGYWTPSGDAVIMYVLGPGRKSVARFTSFIQDADYLQLHADRLFEESLPYRCVAFASWFGIVASERRRCAIDTRGYAGRRAVAVYIGYWNL